MKKTWTNPEITSLDITATAGGPEYNSKEDGQAWKDDQGFWQQPVGGDDKLS